MDQATHNKIVSFIWGIADDVLRDLFKRGKYPDVILPMCVIRRMDAVLEPTKQEVLATRQMLDEAGISEQHAALCAAAGQAFYSTSRFTLRDLKSRGSQQQLLADFEEYLNSFSPNVQDIIENFKFRNQLQTLSRAGALFTQFEQVAAALAERLNNWDSDEDEGANEADDGEAGGARKGLAEARKRKLLDPSSWARDGHLVDVATKLAAALGDALYTDHNVFRARVDAALKQAGIKLAAADRKLIFKAVSWRDESAPPVIAAVYKPGKATADPLHGLFAATVEGKPALVEYEPDPDLRDSEQVPLLEPGGIEAFIRREVLPYTPDAWIKAEATKIGYEISFTRHFYKPQPLRTLEEIAADILAIEQEAEGLLSDIIGDADK